MLTGVKDLDTIILNNLGDKDLVMVCQTSKYVDKICKDQTFWLNRILHKFPYLGMDILNKYKGNRSWSEYYIKDLRMINYENARYYLMSGSENDRLDHVILALNNGANIHFGYDYAIRYASANGYIDIVKYLAEAGANIHVDNDYAIRSASQYGHIDTVKYLVEKGANIHALNDYAIKWASSNGHIDIVKYLAEAGANIHILNDYATRKAYKNKHMDVVNYLVSLGAPDPRNM